MSNLFLLFTVYPNHSNEPVRQTHLFGNHSWPSGIQHFLRHVMILGCLWYYNGIWTGAWACKIPAIVGSDFELLRHRSVSLHICTFAHLMVYIYMLTAAQAAHCVDDTQFVRSGFTGTSGSCGSHKKALGGAAFSLSGEGGSWEDGPRRLNHVEWLNSHDVMGKQIFRYG